MLSRPLWEEFEVWLRLQRTQVPDGTNFAEAIDYSLNAWKALTLHLDDGAVAIDNNLIENSIRPVALGRKNYLFAGSHEAAQQAAVAYSILATCKLHELEPFTYLARILSIIPEFPANQLHTLLPRQI